MKHFISMLLLVAVFATTALAQDTLRFHMDVILPPYLRFVETDTTWVTDPALLERIDQLTGQIDSLIALQPTIVEVDNPIHLETITALETQRDSLIQVVNSHAAEAADLRVQVLALEARVDSLLALPPDTLRLPGETEYITDPALVHTIDSLGTVIVELRGQLASLQFQVTERDSLIQDFEGQIIGWNHEYDMWTDERSGLLETIDSLQAVPPIAGTDTVFIHGITDVYRDYVWDLHVRPVGWAVGTVTVVPDSTLFMFPPGVTYLTDDMWGTTVSGNDTTYHYFRKQGNWRELRFNVSTADIWGTGDYFMMAHTPTVGFSYATAVLEQFTQIDHRARTGIMIREHLDAGSPFIHIVYQNGRVCVGHRLSRGAEVTGSGCISDVTLPIQMEASYSEEGFYAKFYPAGSDPYADGVHEWTLPDFSINEAFYTGVHATSWTPNHHSQTHYSFVAILDSRPVPGMCRNEEGDVIDCPEGM